MTASNPYKALHGPAAAASSVTAAAHNVTDDLVSSDKARGTFK